MCWRQRVESSAGAEAAAYAGAFLLSWLWCAVLEMTKTASANPILMKHTTTQGQHMRLAGMNSRSGPAPRRHNGDANARSTGARAVLAGVVAGLGVLLASQAGAQGVLSPLADLPACERLVADVYKGRLPMPVGGQLMRRAVSCLPGQTKAVLIRHEDHVLEDLPAHDIDRIRPSIQLTGPENPLVRLRCSEPAFRALLEMADVEFQLVASRAPLGTIRITSGMCRV
jgi:hypothetical protein